jgi:hypothetical protein
VRAILPLTRAASTGDAKDRPPGVMVLLDEPAFREHGISEGIVAEIVTTSDWRDGVATKVLQYSRDPIVDATPIEALPSQPQLVRPSGPYGMTNDVPSTLEPLFDASCYVLPAPFDNSAAWDFAHVRFRRVIEDAEPPVVAADDETEWTRPYWIQFAAAANKLAPAEPARAAGGKIQQLGEPASGFWIYAIITARIQSFEGAADEVYVDAAPISGGIATLGREPPTLDLLVRVCEVQATQPLNDAPPDLWAALFPENERADAQLRITRISPPVAVKR